MRRALCTSRKSGVLLAILEELVLVEADPVADISAAAAIEMVVLRGKVVWRAVPFAKAQ
jgi:hypothetical protein